MTVISVSWEGGSALWLDGELADVLGDRATVERVLSQPVEAWRHVDLMGKPDDLETASDVPIGDAEQIDVISPGTPEHAARALLSLPGAVLTQGEEFIPEPPVEEA